jgi:hypothetical protein
LFLHSRVQVVHVCAEHKKPAKLLKHCLLLKINMQLPGPLRMPLLMQVVQVCAEHKKATKLLKHSPMKSIHQQVTTTVCLPLLLQVVHLCAEHKKPAKLLKHPPVNLSANRPQHQSVCCCVCRWCMCVLSTRSLPSC